VQWKEPKHGEIRIISKFLWWPRTFGRTTKWLETSLIKEEFIEAPGNWPGQWREIGFSE
jgi:hypothetical protein